MKKFCQRAASVVAVLALSAPAWAGELGIIPRKQVPKTPTAKLMIPDDATGRLVVKFLDDDQMRAAANGRVQSLSNAKTADINVVLDRLEFTVTPALEKTEAELKAIENEIRNMSGKAQPDTAGIVHASGPRENLLAAARALNDLPEVEWVVVEQWKKPFVEEITERRACCLPDGSCTDQVPAMCETMGGLVYEFVLDCTVNPALCILNGVCCLGEDACILASRAQCEAAGGGFDETAMDCMDYECAFGCGEITAGNCFRRDGNPNVFCNQTACCEFICEVDPFCCDEDNPFARWDQFCAALANVYCAPHTPNWDESQQVQAVWPPPGPDRCAAGIMNEGCYEPHLTGGCDNQACCNLVCGIADFCCTGNWGGLCAFLALLECETINADIQVGDPTPDYTDHQGYLTAAPYNPLPTYLESLIPTFDCVPFFGWNGAGFNLRTEGEDFVDDGYDGIPNTDDVGEGNGWRDPNEPFTDTNSDSLWQPGEPFEDINGDGTWTPGEEFTDSNGNFEWDPPGGLSGLADQLRFDEGIDATGQGNLTRGKNSKAAVIEWACWKDHEDINVIIEPGVDMITIPELTEPDHATACLSIIGGLDNGKGVTGMAPETQLYFFPLTSATDGPRELSAWISAVGTMGPGDVISCSYGPGPPIGNLNNSQDTWTFIRMASDKGTAVCIAAGNDCYNLDNAEDLGDSGGIVVGACSAGSPQYRLAFSNFCTDPDVARSNIVHMRAWGELVTAAGYGAMQLPTSDADPDNPFVDRNRSYTQQFNGTSAATPQIAGAILAVQGYAKQFYGIPLPIDQLRSVFGAPGTPPLPPARLISAGFEGVGCSLDLNPDVGPHWIGVWPNLAGDPSSIAATIVNQTGGGFTGSPLIDDVIIVRGTNVQGNRFSIKASDDARLRVDPLFTLRNTGGVGGVGEGGGSGAPLSAPEVESVSYLATGEITDVVVIGHADIPIVRTMFVQTEITDPNVFAITFLELYDWRTDRWTFGNLVIHDGLNGGDVQTDSPIFAPGRFVRESDKRVLMRLWTIGFPAPAGGVGGAGAETEWTFLLDWVNLFVSEQFGEQLP